MFSTPFTFLSAPVGGGFDPDAQAYIDAVISAGGTLSGGNQNAINTLYEDLKTEGLYSSVKYMYPFMGGIKEAHAICGINPSNSDYLISWFDYLTNSAAHTSAGLNTVSGNGYGFIAKTINNIFSSGDSQTLGVYISTATTNNNAFTIGKSASALGLPRWQFNIPFDSNNVYSALGDANFVIYDNTAAPVGRWYTSRTSSTLITTYKNGLSVATDTVTNTSGLTTASPCFCAAIETNPGYYFTGVMGFTFAADGLTSGQISDLDSILSSFLTSISR
jgi:hypothetical protein